jgi:hypothetical protein
MDFSEFERFCEIKGLRPVEKYETPKATVAIAETDWERPTREHPLGYYQTVFAVGGKASKGNLDVAQWLEFDALHDKDKGMTQEEKRQSRIRATKEEAMKFIEKNIEMGRYA